MNHMKNVTIEAEPEDGEWWTRLEDGRMDPDVHDRRKMLAEQYLLTNTDLVLIPGKPRSMSYLF